MPDNGGSDYQFRAMYYDSALGDEEFEVMRVSDHEAELDALRVWALMLLSAIAPTYRQTRDREASNA